MNSVIQSGHDRPAYRPRRASVIIASPGPDEPDEYDTRFGRIRSRSGARLKYTERDAQRVHALWSKAEPGLPDELHRLLIDPTLREVEFALRDVSAEMLKIYPKDVWSLDLFFAGHGEEATGNLILKDDLLSPRRMLELQASNAGQIGASKRLLGVWLDSCYSGDFLLRLAFMALDEGFRLDEGLASCLPGEQCFELPTLEHGIFTYTRLHRGNAHVDRDRFNQAILQNDSAELVKGLQGMVGMISNPSAFLTEGKQFSMSLIKHVISVDGNFASVELGATNDLTEVTKQLTDFKNTK